MFDEISLLFGVSINRERVLDYEWNLDLRMRFDPGLSVSFDYVSGILLQPKSWI